MHWTYSNKEAGSDLEQGDFLVLTPKLTSVLNDVHPHFCSEKYLGFIITTQSCDLARRGTKPPKARYINIAVVRSLGDMTPRLFESIAAPVCDGLFRRSAKGDAKELLHRVFNQNEQALGLFFMYADADISLGLHSVALLRIVIALKAEHYDILKDARRGGLKPEFQAKLGWLVGNLYSRAATPDWSDYPNGEAELEKLISQHIEEILEGRGPVWVDDVLVDAGRKADVVFHNREVADLVRELENYRPQDSISQLADVVSEEATRALAFRGSEHEALNAVITDAERRLFDIGNIQNSDHAQIRDILNEVRQGVIDALQINDTRLRKLANRLKNNGKIKKLFK